MNERTTAAAHSNNKTHWIFKPLAATILLYILQIRDENGNHGMRVCVRTCADERERKEEKK